MQTNKNTNSRRRSATLTPNPRNCGQLVGAGSSLLLVLLAGLLSTPIARPADSVSHESSCIDLSQYYTAKLTDSLNSPASVVENNLASLPKERQVFSGVPFEVGGILQLSGKKVEEWGRKEYPQAINKIKIGRHCQRLHLLHGAGGVFDPEGLTIGKLVLHYADNSSRELEIKNGVHVRDWWGNPKQAVRSPNSTLAWTGTNPALKKYGGPQPCGLRIYKTTFENPQPEIEITAVDYVSAMENSSPFMIGLTIE